MEDQTTAVETMSARVVSVTEKFLKSKNKRGNIEKVKESLSLEDLAKYTQQYHNVRFVNFIVSFLAFAGICLLGILVDIFGVEFSPNGLIGVIAIAMILVVYCSFSVYRFYTADVCSMSDVLARKDAKSLKKGELDLYDSISYSLTYFYAYGISLCCMLVLLGLYVSSKTFFSVVFNSNDFALFVTLIVLLVAASLFFLCKDNTKEARGMLAVYKKREKNS